MFGAIKKMCKRVASIDQDKVLAEILNEDVVKAQIVDLNQSQLYDQGVQADGTPTGQYAAITVNKYKPLAAAEGRDGRSDHITGKDTGQTYASMKVLSGTKGIAISADDRNGFFDKLPEGLGLTDESISEIIPEVHERLVAKVKEQIYL